MTDNKGTKVPEGTGTRPSNKAEPGRWWLKRLLPLFGVAGTFVTIILIYFGYDYVAARAAPCEAIFRQTKLGLSTKISFLKTEGELKIGREPLVELSERAQMTALNLKTCCTVLDAGKLDPEQFLQCKIQARAYEARVDDIVSVVRKVVAREAASSTVANADSGQTGKAAVVAASVPATGEAAALIKTIFEAARAASQAFNKNVVAVRKAQALETLEALPPRHVEVSAQEREPNNDTLNTNVIEVGKWITGSVGAGKDYDFFTFTTPAKYRDWIHIELENRSTTLRPRIELFDAAKSNLGATGKKTYGANLSYYFVATPETRYTARISSQYGESVGAYLVRVVATKAYDSHEPNDSILAAQSINAGEVVTAKIMDNRDADFYRVDSDGKSKQVEVKIVNGSTTLRPRAELFNSNKSSLGARDNSTAGADLVWTAKITPGSAFYVLVRDRYAEAAGAYELTVTFKP